MRGAGGDRARGGGRAVVDVDPTPGPGGASFFLAFEATVVGGTLAAADDALDAGSFGADELPELAFPSTMDAARRTTARTREADRE